MRNLRCRFLLLISWILTYVFFLFQRVLIYNIPSEQVVYVRSKSFTLALYLDDHYLDSEWCDFVHLVTADIAHYLKRATENRVLLFPPVNSFCRLLIHKTVEDFPELCSFSIGEADARRTVVCLQVSVLRVIQMDSWERDIPGNVEKAKKKIAKDENHCGMTSCQNKSAPTRNSGVQSSSRIICKADSQRSPSRCKTRRPDVRVYVPKGRRISDHNPETLVNAQEVFLPEENHMSLQNDLNDGGHSNEMEDSVGKTAPDRKQKHSKPTIEPYVPRAKRVEQNKQQDTDCGHMTAVSYPVETHNTGSELSEIIVQDERTVESDHPQGLQIQSRNKKHRSKRMQSKDKKHEEIKKGTCREIAGTSKLSDRSTSVTARTKTYSKHKQSEKNVSSLLSVNMVCTENAEPHDQITCCSGRGAQHEGKSAEIKVSESKHICEENNRAIHHAAFTNNSEGQILESILDSSMESNHVGDYTGLDRTPLQQYEFGQDETNILTSSPTCVTSSTHCYLLTIEENKEELTKSNMQPTEVNYSNKNAEILEPTNAEEYKMCCVENEGNNIDNISTEIISEDGFPVVEEQNVENECDGNLHASISKTVIPNISEIHGKNTLKTSSENSTTHLVCNQSMNAKLKLDITGTLSESQITNDDASTQLEKEDEISNDIIVPVEEDDDSWDKMFDDTGEALDDKMIKELTSAVGDVDILKPQFDYINFNPKEPDLDLASYGHLLEIYDFPSSLETRDLIIAFKEFQDTGFDIKWVDDNHAIGVFSSSFAARSALSLNHPLIKVRCLREATRQTRLKAKKTCEFLQPYKQRPETVASVARNMVAGALGIRSKVTKEKQEEERKKIKEAKEKKKKSNKMKKDAWDGIYGHCAMDES